jgi:hypothetical protein
VKVNGVEARIWEDWTKDRVPVPCMVTRIVPLTDNLDQLALFDKGAAAAAARNAVSLAARQVPW